MRTRHEVELDSSGKVVPDQYVQRSTPVKLYERGNDVRAYKYINKRGPKAVERRRARKAAKQPHNAVLDT